MSGRAAYRRHEKRRRGVTIIVVLTLISITLAISYGLLRSQMTAIQIQANSGRRELAQQAAMSGLSIGLRRMNLSTWGGVDTTVTGSLSANESYEVTYSTGDADLQAGDADFSRYPFRVTLKSTGRASDSAHPGVVTQCYAEAVVELAPRALGTQPTGWSAIQLCTVFQVDDHTFEITPPCRIEGVLRLQQDVSLGDYYDWSDAARLRYFSDLKETRSRGLGDVRPITGPIFSPASSTDSELISLAAALGVLLIETPVGSRITFTSPSSSFFYQLYPGGQRYLVPTWGSTLSNVEYSADPQTNPLGLFRSPSSLIVGDNVSVQGTIIGRDDVTITGNNVQFRSVPLPALNGANSPVRLPALVVNDDLSISASARGTLDGNILANGDFRVLQDASGPNFQILGRVTSDVFSISGRDNWKLSDADWSTTWTSFKGQAATGGIDLFPVWLAQNMLGNAGLNPIPTLTIKPNPTPLTAHWQDLTQPIYVPASGDDGLRWNLVRWLTPTD